METNLQIIRAACIAANPEIVELKFGCEVKNKKFAYTFFVSFYDKENEVVVYCPKEFDNQFHHDSIEHFEEGKMEIIGRPIRLDDCRKIVKKDLWGELIIIWGDGYLENQPESVIKWLYENKN